MRRILLLVALIAVSVCSAQAAEDSVTFVGGVDLGFKKLNLDVGKTSEGEGGGHFNPSYVTIGPNLALGTSSFYASLSYDKSLTAQPETGMDGSSASVLEFSRTDTTLTLGYRISPSFSVFAGYAEGSNDFTETTAGGTGLRTKDITYTETGPFAGFAYSKAFGDNGSLSFSLGYAKLDGELKIVDHGGSDPDQKSTGENTGLSYGIIWSGPLTGSLAYRAGLKATRYEMKRGRDNPQDITENYLSLFFGVMNYF